MDILKNKIFLLIILAILLTGGYWYMYWSSVTLEKNSVRDTIPLKRYHDSLHRFSIEYPGYLTPGIDNTISDPVIISFIDEQNPGEMGVIGILISTTTALSAREWVEKNNEENYNRDSAHIIARNRIEREITISGIQGVVVHPYSDWPGGHEEFTYEKSVLLVKDGKLFNIGAFRTTDQEKVWNSFRFEE